MEIVFRLLHILPAITLAGGVFFVWLALAPALSGLPEGLRGEFFERIRRPWSQIVMLCTALLLATGLFNGLREISRNEIPGYYHALVMSKLVLGIGVFFITAVLSGRSSMAVRFREKLSFWLTVNALLLLGLIVIAGCMRFVPRQLKQDVPSTNTSFELGTNSLVRVHSEVRD